jgi:hypothetical protein
MKRLLLLMIIVACGVAVMAQFRPAKTSKLLQNRNILETPAIDNPSVFLPAGNPIVNSKSALEDILGTSGAYDMQSNSSSMERVVCWPDGTVSASWMMANVPTTYSDRGSGYNYFDGTTWGPAPAVRIESIKTGWPNLCKWNGNGEIVMSHNSTSKLVICTRPVKGTGAWTQTLGPTGPIGSAGAALSLLWPRVITNGNNNQNIHIIVLTMPVGNGGIKYRGIDGAMLYYRSTDGGTTWDKQAILLPELDSTHFNAFGGDDYSWIEPHGDTIAFLQGDTWNGTFLMKSFDNGNTWTKQDILVGYYAKAPATDTIGAFYGCDGTIAGAMDKNGVFHVALGRMYAQQYAGSSGFGKYWSASTDGVVYWNSTEAPLDTAMMSDLNLINAQHKLIGYVASNSAGDSIVGFPYYKGGLSTYPQVTIDQYNNIFFLWSSLTVGNPDPTPYNFRHVWGRAWFNGHTAWTEMMDFNADIFSIFIEFAYPEVSKTLKNNKLQLVIQTSTQPGSNVAAGTSYPAVPVHEVSFNYREISTSEFIPAGIPTATAINRNYVGQNFPNPVNGTTSFNASLDKPANVIIEVSNVMGQKVMSIDKGMLNSGAQKFTIDCSQFTSGIYFYTVKINGESYTHKMIVE